jgi:predicted anti-sigma-YlaC factor YlaD
MSEIHLQETELASGESKSVTEHLRWCSQCRSAAAEYHWLQERIEDTLAVTANAVSVPHPKWRVVKRRMVAGQKRQITGWRASATAGIALVFCAILSLSSIVGVTVAVQTSFPEAVMTPASVTAIISDAHKASVATPTPVASREGIESPSTLTLPPLPTPPEPDA